MERSQLSGYSLGVLTALCWAISPIFIRKGLIGLPSSPWGTAVGLAAAMSFYWIWFALRRGWRGADSSIRVALAFQSLAGVLAGVATIARTTAIERAPVVVAIPLTQTASLFTLVYAVLLLGQQMERVTIKLVIGTVCIVAGSTLVILGQHL